MVKRIIKTNPLFFAFLLPALTDGVVTLLGQSKQYWNSNRVVNEASPAYYFLLASPWIYLLGAIIWFIFWYWLFKKFHEVLKLFFMFLFIAGHSWGSSSWIMKIFKDNGFYSIGNQNSIIIVWFILILYFVSIALIATSCLRLYYKITEK